MPAAPSVSSDSTSVIAEILQTLVTLGCARPGDTKGTFGK